jgi:hypothetical protein
MPCASAIFSSIGEIVIGRLIEMRGLHVGLNQSQLLTDGACDQGLDIFPGQLGIIRCWSTMGLVGGAGWPSAFSNRNDLYQR